MRVAVALFDGAEELDFASPWEVLAFWAEQMARAEVEIVTVAPSLAPFRAAKGRSTWRCEQWPSAAR